MESQFFDDIPPMPDRDPIPMAPQPNGGGNIEIKTSNANMGAQRIAVPRDLGRVMMKIDQLAQQFGHRWKYSIPFKNKKTNKTELVEGPTIGCALDIARAYGNCSVGMDGDVQETADSYIFNAVYLDIEDGFRLTRPFRQRKGQNVGGMGGDRGRVEDVVFQIGASKALRNVVVNALRGIVDEALDRAQNRLTEKIRANRGRWIERIRENIAEYDIPETRIARFYGKPLDELKEHRLAEVAKMLIALKDDMIKPEEFCPESMSMAENGQPAATPGETVVDMPADDDGQGGDGRAAPEKVTVKWGGKDLNKTAFLRDVKFGIKRCEELRDLDAFAAQIGEAKQYAEGDAPKMWAEIDEAIQAARAKLSDDSAEPPAGQSESGGDSNLFDE